MSRNICPSGRKIEQKHAKSDDFHLRRRHIIFDDDETHNRHKSTNLESDFDVSGTASSASTPTPARRKEVFSPTPLHPSGSKDYNSKRAASNMRFAYEVPLPRDPRSSPTFIRNKQATIRHKAQIHPVFTSNTFSESESSEDLSKKHKRKRGKRSSGPISDDGKPIDAETTPKVESAKKRRKHKHENEQSSAEGNGFVIEKDKKRSNNHKELAPTNVTTSNSSLVPSLVETTKSTGNIICPPAYRPSLIQDRLTVEESQATRLLQSTIPPHFLIAATEQLRRENAVIAKACLKDKPTHTTMADEPTEHAILLTASRNLLLHLSSNRLAALTLNALNTSRQQNGNDIRKSPVKGSQSPTKAEHGSTFTRHIRTTNTPKTWNIFNNIHMETELARIARDREQRVQVLELENHMLKSELGTLMQAMK